MTGDLTRRVDWRVLAGAAAGGLAGIVLGLLWSHAVDDGEGLFDPNAVLAFLGSWWAGTVLGVAAVRHRRRSVVVAAATFVALLPVAFVASAFVPKFGVLLVDDGEPRYLTVVLVWLATSAAAGLAGTLAYQA